ncbi:increased DNA methylation 1-like isoform X1 [Primulina tabacum]|uniref:increased DNA methylation 1-like isoform X1 n=2 Tax=Primulina tabacum TaxID=48773 RepID=UPI003F5A923E
MFSLLLKLEWSRTNDAVVKEGIVKNGHLLCLCCWEELSISEFKRHAGFGLNSQCMNLFMENGKSLILSQLEAWSAEYLARKAPLEKGRVFHVGENDEFCGLCGSAGDLVCCDNCPSAFHQACMLEQVLPPGSWYCLHCCCQTCGIMVNGKDGGLRCSLCKHKYHYGCVQNQITDGGLLSDRWFCTQSCHEIYSGLESRIGLMNHLSSGISWTLLKCIDGDHKAHSSKHFVALKAECNSKLAVAIKIMEECFRPMEDEDTKISMIPQAIYNWGSQLPRFDYSDFYAVILEKNDITMSVACIRIHGAKLAELPFIATCKEHQGKGNFRLLVESIEKMLKTLNVEKLLVASHSELVSTWMDSFHFQHLEEEEKQNLCKVNLMVLPGSTWLKKCL